MCDQAQVPALASLLPRLSSGLPVLTTMPYYYLLMIVSIGFASASEWPYHNWAQWAVRVRILSMYNGQLWHCRGQLSAKMFDVSEWRSGDEEIWPAVCAETREIAVFNSGEGWGYCTALLHWNAPAAGWGTAGIQMLAMRWCRWCVVFRWIRNKIFDDTTVF